MPPRDLSATETFALGLRICRVTHALYPDMIGGSAIFCHELTQRQAEAGDRITVLTARRKGLPRSQTIRPGYRITRFDRVWMPWDSLGMYNPVTPSLYGEVARPDWDLIDAHSHLFWTTALSVKAAVETGKPAITTVHGLVAVRDWFTNFSQKAYLLSVGAWVLRNSTRVVCLTKSDAIEVANLGVPKRNIAVVPSAVDPSRYRRGGICTISILWVGRLVAEKDLGTLIEAVSKMKKVPSLRVVIVGEGPERNALVALARKANLAGTFTFKSATSRDEIVNLLSETEVFAIPSLREGLPLALLEAMASSKLVVASDLPSIREVLGDAGLYFAPGNSSELAEKLERAIEDTQLQREKGSVARRIVEEQFSWNAILPRLEELYSEVTRE